MPEEIEVFEPFDIAIDPTIADIDLVTVTRIDDVENYYVFSAQGESGLTAPAASEATEANAEADIRAALEGQFLFNLAAAQAAKTEEIAASCRAEYTATLVTSYGAAFHATSEAILDVMNIITSLDPEAVFPGYKGADDVWRDLTREQFELALLEGSTRKATAFAKRKTLTDQINAATTAAELTAIAW